MQWTKLGFSLDQAKSTGLSQYNSFMKVYAKYDNLLCKLKEIGKSSFLFQTRYSTIYESEGDQKSKTQIGFGTIIKGDITKLILDEVLFGSIASENFYGKTYFKLTPSAKINLGGSFCISIAKTFNFGALGSFDPSTNRFSSYQLFLNYIPVPRLNISSYIEGLSEKEYKPSKFHLTSKFFNKNELMICSQLNVDFNHKFNSFFIGFKKLLSDDRIIKGMANSDGIFALAYKGSLIENLLSGWIGCQVEGSRILSNLPISQKWGIKLTLNL